MSWYASDVIVATMLDGLLDGGCRVFVVGVGNGGGGEGAGTPLVSGIPLIVIVGVLRAVLVVGHGVGAGCNCGESGSV